MSELTSDLTHTSQRATTLTNVQLLDGPKVNLRLSGGSILPVDTPDPLDRVIDAKGADLLPPIFDSHVQLSEPGFEHREDLGETVAIAASGGVCHLLGLPFTDPPLDRPSALYATQERVSGHAGAGLSLVAEDRELLQHPLVDELIAHARRWNSGNRHVCRASMSTGRWPACGARHP